MEISPSGRCLRTWFDKLCGCALCKDPTTFFQSSKSCMSGRTLAHIYIERHVQDLADRPGVLQIHTYQRCADVTSSLKKHADLRVDALYPPAAHGQEGGALLPGLAELVQEQRSRPASAGADPRPASSPVDSVSDGKQSTMHDTARTSAKVFEHVRPSIVTDEGETANTFAPEVVVEHAMHNVLDMTVRMSNQFEEQFISKYMPRICPWALNYDCGGPEYPHLFANWDDLLANQEELLAHGIQQRWRKVAGEAALVPGEYAQMLSTRAEMQIAGDWMVVPVARNLHWRYAVLHSSLSHNLEQLIEATRKIWHRIAQNVVVINGHKKNINGNVGMLFSADDITGPEKIILKSCLNTTSNIAGCQAIRSKIGHCCFGFRVVHGEVIFVTVSPNRRNSSMILKFSRARRNDTSLDADDPMTQSRRKYCGKNAPKIFAQYCGVEDTSGEATAKEIPLPDLWMRQAWNAQDPMSSCHHYLFFMYVILPTVFGLRMCFLCPDCNADGTDPKTKRLDFACSDCRGCNSKLVGGYAGMATGMAFATEYQGEANSSWARFCIAREHVSTSLAGRDRDHH